MPCERGNTTCAKKIWFWYFAQGALYSKNLKPTKFTEAMVCKRAAWLTLYSWLAMWLAVCAPAMCQRHGLLYFYAPAANGLPIWALDEPMCGDLNGYTQHAAQPQAHHHTENAAQTASLLAFLMPHMPDLQKAPAMVRSVRPTSEKALPRSIPPLVPPPRLSAA